ncbi:major facilitator superfamily domain-containing protein [Dipodascopsis tothii]|uniref:major facilitator superfamily domain-containing protein n=1 Tax=Dipodascopsis tothii TaxID=44089 RepID=UPI0034CDDEC5
MGRFALGIKQPLVGDDDEVVGTVTMLVSEDTNAVSDYVNEHSPQAMRTKKTKTGIVLHPQPHDDPNDPLNWPRWRRDTALAVIGFHCFIGGGQTPILASGFKSMATEFDVTLSKLAYLVGGFMLALGVGSVVSAPVAILYGKRFTYLAGVVVLFVGSIWAGLSHSYASLLGARVLSGLGVSPCESLPSATIAEIYFLHERAYRVGIYTLLLLGGKNILPLVSGFVISDLGWNWVFWLLAIVVGLNFVLVFLFVPETFWDRSPVPHDRRSQKETESAREAFSRSGRSRSSLSVTLHVRAPPPDAEKDPPLSVSDHSSPTVAAAGRHAHFGPDADKAEPAKRTFVQELRVFSGRHTRDPFWKVACRPFVLFLYPAVLFATVLYSMSVVWLIVMSESLSEIFENDHYRMSATSVGLLYVSPFVGGILGTAAAGRVSDVIVRYLIRRNNGTYEPEFRLVMVLFVALSVTIGLMGFGWSAYEEDAWIVPTVFFGVISFGCCLGSTTAITFAVDSYRMYAGEALVTINFSKNVLGFVFSLFTNSFLDRAGYRTTFLTFGGIQLAICLFAVPLYVYGKCLRHWTERKQFMYYLA